MILIFGSQAILDEIGFTPIIEGGIGAVAIGTSVISRDNRVAIAHPFSDVDLDWFRAYTQGESPKVTVSEELPKDFEVRS